MLAIIAKSPLSRENVSHGGLPDGTAAIGKALAVLGEDLNGNGQVAVRLVQYASDGGR